jgi:hypothetical protein
MNSPVGHPAPTDREEVLSPSWLGAALQEHLQGEKITDVVVVEEQETLATKIRCELHFARESDELLRNVCIKGFFGPRGAERAWIGEPEALFYSELAPTLDLRMPRCLYAAVDPVNSHGLVIMNDLIVEGARFLTALSPYSPSQVADTLGQLASLHIQTWDDSRLSAAWLEPRVSAFTDYISVEALQELLDGERGRPLPDDVRRADRVRAGVREVFEVTAIERRCLVHGDAHAGNLYLTADGAPGLLDWQILRRGHWSFDVAYHIAAALEVEDRREHEGSLVREYVDLVRSAEVPLPSWDEAWRCYQRALVYGYNLWAVTSTVDPRITNEFVRRLGSAVADNESLVQLGV